MRTPHKLLTILEGLSYGEYVKSVIKPVIWLKFNELAGATAINYGTGGAAYNGTYTSCTLAQQGKMSATGAVLFDGALSKVALALPNPTTQRWAFLVKATTIGELNAGAFITMAAAPDCWFRFASSTNIRASIKTDTVAAAAVSAVNSVDFLGVWAWVFMDYDDAGTRKIRLWKGFNHTLSALTLTTDTAATGTVTPEASGTIGNTSGQAWTQDGLIDEALYGPALWTTAEMQALINLTGV